MSNVYLVGFMGAGKTSVGAALAAHLGYGFLDLDERLSERFGAPIREIFDDSGEEIFRVAETEELSRSTDLERVVVATGGGTFCSEANREIIFGAGGVSVFLDAPWEELCRRLPGENLDRPMFGDEEMARLLLSRRMSHYRQATLTVAVKADDTPLQTASRVVEALREAPCAT